MSLPDSTAPHAGSRKHALLAALVACGVLLAVGSGVVLANGNPFAGYPPAKAALLRHEQEASATARALPHPTKNPSYTPPTSPPQAPPVAGIENLHEGPFPACQLLVSDFWQGPVNGQWYLVYAGSASASIVTCDHSRGALAIYSEQVGRYGDGPITNIGMFTAPSGVTSLTITAVTGHTMTLQTPTGAITFDLSSNRFVTQAR